MKNQAAVIPPPRKLDQVKTLLIDNYDSFTFNLAQYLAQVNGEEPIIVKNDEWSFAQLMELSFDNIVISPGPGSPDNPADFGVCREVVLNAPFPILGVCLGFQGIALLHGCKVVRAAEPRHGQTSRITHGGTELFKGIPSPFEAVRYHSLYVPDLINSELEETAHSEDGVLMALRHIRKPVWGVQFHPESIHTEYGHDLLRNFRDLSLQRTAADPGRRKPSSASLRYSRNAGTPKNSVRYEKTSQAPCAEAVFAALYANNKHCVWLDSNSAGGLSRFSYIADTSHPDDFVIRYRSRNHQLEVIGKNSQHSMEQSIFDFLRDALAQQEGVCGDLPFEFCGGFIGYFGYELKGECGGKYRHESDVPDAWFLRVSRFIAYDHATSDCYAVASGGTAEDAQWIAATIRRLREVPDLVKLPTTAGETHEGFTLEQNEREYLQNIGSALEKIRAGESYEVCLTNRIRGRFDRDPFRLYRLLRRRNPAPFAAFLKSSGFAILGSSPERFLHIDSMGRIEARPMKGTIARSADPVEDRRLAELLRSSPKNRSENLMITDLLRNDLGRVATIGSVQVPSLMAVEPHATVHQMVSTITAQLAEPNSAIDCIRAAFPGGSMTGAPKLRTMDILDSLESSARGVYSGALGYLSYSGAVDLCISIRTMVASHGSICIGVGGAIVALSDPRQEFEETLLKGSALLAALADERSTME